MLKPSSIDFMFVVLISYVTHKPNIDCHRRRRSKITVKMGAVIVLIFFEGVFTIF